MKNQFKTVLIRHLVLQFLDFFALKLDKFAAPHAHHVIVVALGIRPLVKIAVAPPDGFLNGATFKQKRNGAIDRVSRNPQAFFLEAVIKVVGIEVMLAVSDLCVDALSFEGALQASVPEQFLEFSADFFRSVRRHSHVCVRIMSY